MNVLVIFSSSSTRVFPSCRPARNNTICFQSEQKSETIFHQNGKYQISHLPRFIKQDLGQGGGVAGLYFGIPLAGQDTISLQSTGTNIIYSKYGSALCCQRPN